MKAPPKELHLYHSSLATTARYTFSLFCPKVSKPWWCWETFSYWSLKAFLVLINWTFMGFRMFTPGYNKCRQSLFNFSWLKKLRVKCYLFQFTLTMQWRINFCVKFYHIFDKIIVSYKVSSNDVNTFFFWSWILLLYPDFQEWKTLECHFLQWSKGVYENIP